MTNNKDINYKNQKCKWGLCYCKVLKVLMYFPIDLTEIRSSDNTRLDT